MRQVDVDVLGLRPVGTSGNKLKAESKYINFRHSDSPEITSDFSPPARKTLDFVRFFSEETS